MALRWASEYGWEGESWRLRRRACSGLSCGCREVFADRRASAVRARRATSAADRDAYSRIYGKALARWGEQQLLLRVALVRAAPPARPAHRRAPAGDAERWQHHRRQSYLCRKRHASCRRAASLAQSPRLRTASLLVHEMMLEACLRSLAWFDHIPSAGHDGRRVFKECMGAVGLPSPVIVCSEARAPLLGCALCQGRDRDDARA
jgi:hypothetical protein